MSNKEEDIQVLLASIHDVQETIRAFDLKAEILTAILTLLVGMVAFSWHDVTGVVWTQVVVIVSAFTAMGCLLAVLLPLSNPSERVQRGSYRPAGVFFIAPKTLKEATVSEVAEILEKLQWREELVFELMKLSYIRQRKHFWFRNATWVTAVSLAAILVLCLAKYKALI